MQRQGFQQKHLPAGEGMWTPRARSCQGKHPWRPASICRCAKPSPDVNRGQQDSSKRSGKSRRTHRSIFQMRGLQVAPGAITGRTHIAFMSTMAPYPHTGLVIGFLPLECRQRSPCLDSGRWDHLLVKNICAKTKALPLTQPQEESLSNSVPQSSHL